MFRPFWAGLEKKETFIISRGPILYNQAQALCFHLAPQNNCPQLWELESILRFFVLPGTISYLCIHFRIYNFGCVQMPVDHMKVKICGRMEPPIFENRESRESLAFGDWSIKGWDARHWWIPCTSSRKPEMTESKPFSSFFPCEISNSMISCTTRN